MFKKIGSLICFFGLTFVFVGIFHFFSEVNFVDAEDKDSFKSEQGLSVEVDRFAVCRVIDNSNSRPVFIPAKTQMEWCKFIDALPPGVSVSPCIRERTESELVCVRFLRCGNGCAEYGYVDTIIPYEHNFSNCPENL